MKAKNSYTKEELEEGLKRYYAKLLLSAADHLKVPLQDITIRGMLPSDKDTIYFVDDNGVVNTRRCLDRDYRKSQEV